MALCTVHNVKELFLEACQSRESQSFLDIMDKHKSKTDDFSVSDSLLGMSKKQHEKLWKGLFDLCARTLANLNPSGDPSEQTSIDDVLRCLQGIVTVGTCSLESKEPVTPAKMLDTLTVLHGVLLDLPETANKLQYNIAKLCHMWWKADLADRELLVPNTLMFFLVKTIPTSGTKADVKNLYVMRESFAQIHLGDESSASMKDLLEQCFISHTFLKCDEGQKFLSFLFCLDIDLVERFHSAIKTQLPSCPKNMVGIYGDIYFKAWRNSVGPVTAKIETCCIQDVMHRAIHARHVGTGNLALTLRQFLSAFAKQKRQQGVDKMLLELYEPILWRSFKVANAEVRANAAGLLIEAFPLQNPEASKEDTDALLQKQFDIIQGFLSDPCPVVRVTGVQGICRILGVYWELIPTHVLTTFLTKLIQDMAFDASSSDVRVAVFKGLGFVVDNPLSHPILKNLLPALKNFIHDTAEKVIIALVDLLIKVKGLKTIKVWSIVPVEDLLARLEMDSPPVARRIVDLLFKSFQPSDRDPGVQVERVMALICMNPGAARVFYQYAHKHMSVATCADFMLLLGRCVRGCINQAKLQNSTASGDGSTDEEGSINEADGGGGGDAEEDGLSLKDMDVIEGMLEIVAILWTGISHLLAKPVNQPVMQKLVARFSKDLPKFLATFQDGRSLSAVLVIASLLPSSAIPAFSHSCVSKLKNIGPTASPDAYGPILQCLVSWGKGNDIITLISDWLEAAMKRSHDSSEAEEEESVDESLTKKKKKVTFNEPLKPQPGLALDYLDWLLTNYSSRTVLFDTSAKSLQELVATLKHIMPYIEKRLLSSGPISALMTDEMLVSMVMAYCRLCIHLQSLETAEPVSPTGKQPCHVGAAFEELLAWCDRELLPILPRTSGQKSEAKPETDVLVHKLAKDCLLAVIKMSSDAVMLGFGGDGFQSQLADFCHLLLQTDDRLDFVGPVAKVMCHLGRGGRGVDARQQDVLADLFTKFIKAVGSTASQEDRDTAQLQQTLSSIKPAISDILRHTDQSAARFHDDALASTMAACVGEMTNAVVNSDGTLDPASTPAELPVISQFLVGVVSTNKELLRSFVYELERCISSGAMQTHPTLLAALHILHPLSHDKKRGAGCGIKECLTAIQQQVDRLGREDGEKTDEGVNDPQKFMLEQIQTLEQEISSAIGGVA